MTPLEQGAKAFSDGVPLIHNPYLRYTHEWDLWNEGWRDEWWSTATLSRSHYHMQKVHKTNLTGVRAKRAMEQSLKTHTLTPNRPPSVLTVQRASPVAHSLRPMRSSPPDR